MPDFFENFILVDCEKELVVRFSVTSCFLVSLEDYVKEWETVHFLHFNTFVSASYMAQQFVKVCHVVKR